MAHLDDWLNEHLAAVIRSGSPVGRGRALRLLLVASDAERFDALRYAILTRVLVAGFKQRAGEVANLLKQEVLGRTGSIVVGGDPEDDGDEEGMSVDRVPTNVDARPLAELVVLGVDELDRDKHWDALAEEERQHPIGWLARRVTWRLRDRLRPHEGKATGGVEQVRAHHRVAALLEAIMLADHECGGKFPELRGLHRSVIVRIRDHLDEKDMDGVAYALRKLFPSQAWSPEDPTGVAEMASWLLGKLHTQWSVHERWPSVSEALCVHWLAPPHSAQVRPALEASAGHHLHRDAFPSMPEVELWCDREGDPWLGRKITRIGAEIDQFVEAAVRRVVEAAVTA